MVKLLRLKGDLSDNPNNNREIVNNFRQPILVKPNAKIALVGLDLTLQTDNVLEEDSTLIYNGTSMTVPAGTYNSTQIAQTLNSLISTTAATQSLTRGDQIEVSVSNNGKLNFKAEAYNQVDCPYASQFFILNGTATANDDGSLSSADLTEELQALSDVPVTNSGFHFEVELEANGAADELTYGIFTDEILAAFQIDAAANNYYVIYQGQQIDTGVAVVANQTAALKIDYNRSTVRFQIESPVGTNVYNQTQAFTAADWITWFGNTEGPMASHYVEIPANSTQSLINGKSTLLGDGETGTRLELNFGTVNFRNYLGFREVPPELDGLSPELQADDPYGSWIKNPGIMVTIDPFILESYDGEKSSAFQPNILYVINNPNYEENSVRLDVPNPIFLDIRNEREINLNYLRVSFWSSTSEGDKKPLTYTKAPIVTVIIDDST